MASYSVSGRSRATAEEIFALLADGPGWSKWAGPIIIKSWWEREGVPAPGGVGAIRRFGIKLISSREEIVSYEPPTSMSYRVLSGLPVRDYLATVVLTPDSTGTAISWSGEFTPLVPGTARVLSRLLHLMISDFVRRVTAAAESGG